MSVRVATRHRSVKALIGETQSRPLLTAEIINTVAGRLPLSAERPVHLKVLVSQGIFVKCPSQTHSGVMWSDLLHCNLGEQRLSMVPRAPSNAYVDANLAPTASTWMVPRPSGLLPGFATVTRRTASTRIDELGLRIRETTRFLAEATTRVANPSGHQDSNQLARRLIDLLENSITAE